MDEMSAPDGHLGGGASAAPRGAIRTLGICIGAESWPGADRTGKELSEGVDGLAAFAAGGG
jgi:hypothetical protein